MTQSYQTVIGFYLGSAACLPLPARCFTVSFIRRPPSARLPRDGKRYSGTHLLLHTLLALLCVLGSPAKQKQLPSNRSRGACHEGDDDDDDDGDDNEHSTPSEVELEDRTGCGYGYSGDDGDDD